MRFPFLLAGILLCLDAHASLENLASAAPVPNYVYLHDSPSIGDFSRYRSVDGSQLMEVRLEGIDGEGENRRYIVRVQWPEASGLASGFLREHAYEFDVNGDGSVIAAMLIHVPSARRIPVNPAGPGEIGFIGSPRVEPVAGGQSLSLAQAVIPVETVLLYETSQQTVAGPSRMTSTNFISTAVPFGLVKQVNVMETEVRMVEVAQLILEHSGAGDSIIKVLDWIMEKSKRQRFESGMTLVEFHREE